MMQLVAGTVFLLLVARLLRMPPVLSRFILAGAILVLLGTQLLPPGTPLREEVRGSLGPLAWIAAAALPLLGYGLLIRAIRRRTLPPAGPARPRGLVLIPDDAALVRDTEAALAREPCGGDERLSLAWRDDGGNLAGHVRLRFRPGLAELELLWVAPASRRRGIGCRLVAESEAEARRRGAAGLFADSWTDDGASFLARRGFVPYAASGPRRHLEKPLP